MRRLRLLLPLSAIGLYFSGCTTVDQKLGDEAWYQKSRAAAGKAVEASRPIVKKAIATSEFAAGKAYERMQGYLARKDKLSAFTDAGKGVETDVLKVLRDSGLTSPRLRANKGPGTVRPKNGAPPPGPGPDLGAVPERYAGRMIWPVDAGIFSSEFGPRPRDFHKGIDIAADTGEPVKAIADGEVIYAGDGLRGYGNVVILRHDRNLSSLYAHNSELKVKQGDHVRQGALISLLGSTGRSTGPHVNFEIRSGDKAVNPRGLLPAPDFGRTALGSGSPRSTRLAQQS